MTSPETHGHIDWSSRIQKRAASRKRQVLRIKLADRDEEFMASTKWWSRRWVAGRHMLGDGASVKTNFIGDEGNLTRS